MHFPVINKKFFEAPIYCKPLRILTPTKPPEICSGNEEIVQSDQQKNLSTENKSFSNIPGLTKSQQKRANRKAKEKAKQDELKQKADLVKSQHGSVILKGEKQAELSRSLDIEFNDLGDQPIVKSKFFMKPSQINQESLVREEVWKQYMHKRNPKRSRNSPENRNDIRGSKKPSLK